MAKDLVIGKIQTVDGIPTIVPLDHHKQTLEYQHKLRELIAAATAFKADGHPKNLARLMRAARDL